jgi:glycosyltransferase involved in cell wall biosynthesis
MRVAIIHDVYIEMGGAERVLHTLLKMYPDADLYVPLIAKDKLTQLHSLTSGKIISSPYNHIPFIHSASILLKPFLYWYWEQLDLSQYDLVLSSSHSFSSKSVITGPQTLHLSYVHTSPRYLYTEFNETQIIKKPIIKDLVVPLLSWLRIKDFIGAQRPDVLIANSKTVQRRITKYYRRKSTIIYPPVSIPKRQIKPQKKEYYLCFSRLAKQKGVDLAIKACNELEAPLVVVGTGSEEEYLRSIAGPTISFKGFVSDAELAQIFAKAKAMIYCSIEEDFGMAPVEAMANGIPVIAYNSGGASETIIQGKTGEFFTEYSPIALVSILQKFKPEKYSAAICRKQAQNFSEEHFISNFKRAISESLKAL